MPLPLSTILLVEDNPDDALLTQRAARKANLPNPVLVVEDGQAAIDYLSGAGEYTDRGRFPLPGLVLLDLNLPRKSGFEVLAWIRTQPELHALPVVMLTSSHDIPTIERAFSHGANAFLVKPPAPEALCDLVTSLAAEFEQPPRILLIDDSPDDRLLALRELRRAFPGVQVTEIDSAEALTAALERGDFDLVISDVSMPWATGLGNLRDVKSRWPEYPVIILTSAGSEQIAREAISARLDDYVLKSPQNIVRLPLAVRTALGQARQRRALRESEEHFRALTENASDLIIVLKPGGASRYISPSVERLLGYKVDELIGRSVADFVHPDDQPAALGAIAHRLQTPGLSDRFVEFRLRHKDGSFRTMEVIGNNLLENPAVSGIVINARDITERKQRESELEAINRISTALRAARTLDEMLPRLLDETLAVLRAEAGILFLYDAGRDEIRKAAARGWLTGIPNGPLPAREGMTAPMLAAGETCISPEIPGDARLGGSLWERVPPGWGGVYAPIRAEQAVIGFFFVSVQLPREITAQEARLLTTLAEIAGNAIHRTRLHEQTRRQVERLAALHAVDTAISASMDLRVTLDFLLDHVVTQLGVDAAAVLLLNPHTLTLKYAAGRGFRSPAIERTRLRLGEDHAGLAALERRLVSVPSLPESGAAHARAELLAGEAFIAYFAAPLIAKGQVCGVLEVFHRAPLRPDAEWLDYLDTLVGQAAIAIDNAELFDDLQRSNMDLFAAYDATIEGWSHALDLRDKETEGHTQRVAEMTQRLAREMGMSETELVHIRRGALLHDIGKMGVPDPILLKPGALTEEEWVIMRKHPLYAYEMLSPIAYLRPALDIPYCHHEKWDGTGYPRGLKGEQIPLAARLFAVVDVWDALTSDRSYRPAWPEEKARAYIREQAGAHFDPQVVEVFLKMV
ncbi:MAG: response regulator [Anaerolineales bacterium]|nr:response regulator [Anaerolineales bacterium]